MGGICIVKKILHEDCILMLWGLHRGHIRVICGLYRALPVRYGLCENYMGMYCRDCVKRA